MQLKKIPGYGKTTRKDGLGGGMAVEKISSPPNIKASEIGA
jgi:hypothetical protein